MSRLSEAEYRLGREWFALKRLWQETRADWQDAPARRFEEEYWEPLEQAVPLALRALRELAALVD